MIDERLHVGARHRQQHAQIKQVCEKLSIGRPARAA
jgi:hypothetical protein